MRKTLLIFLLLTAAAASAASPFCDGFAQGFKSIKGNMAMVPMCPLEPLTPLGKTPFQMGILAGIRAAQR